MSIPRSLLRDEVRRIDAYAIQRLGVQGVVLMENAGRNAADAIEQFLIERHGGAFAGRSVAVVAGAGNNGGDGFVVARHLSMRGARVVTFLVAPREKITGDALVNLRIIEALGLDIRQAGGDLGQTAIGNLAGELRGVDLIVDAVGGTGITGPLRGDAAAAVEQINAAASRSGETSDAAAPSRRPAVVAIDIPTGLDCDTGLPNPPAVRADLTVTFVARKKGFDAPTSEQFTGRVIVADIGIPAELVLAAGR